MRIYYCQVSSHLDNYLVNLDNQRGQMKEGQSHVQCVHNMEINIRRRRGGEGREGEMREPGESRREPGERGEGKEREREGRERSEPGERREKRKEKERD